MEKESLFKLKVNPSMFYFIPANAVSDEELKSHNNNELMYLEPCVKIHQFSKIKSKNKLSSFQYHEL